MTSNIAFYGVPDLKEILGIIQKEGLSVALKNCRPGKTILYLQVNIIFFLIYLVNITSK